MAVARLPISNLVAALAATELEAGATVDEAEVVEEAPVAAAEPEETTADEEVLVTRFEDPATGVLEAGAAAEEDEPEPPPTGEEPEGAGELAGIELLLAGIEVATGAEEIADDEGPAQVESAISLTLTHWVTESLWVV